MNKKIIMIFTIACISCIGFYINDKEKSMEVSFITPFYNKVIILDPGHGGYDNGASFGGVNEDDINLSIALVLKEQLERKGATVHLTREDDQDMTQRDYLYSKQDDMYLRVKKINELKGDLLISIHCNASSTTSAWGSQVFYYSSSKKGKEVAGFIHEAMKEVTGSSKNISGCNFKVVRETNLVGVLIECGFLSNSNERGQLVNKGHQLKLVNQIITGVETYFVENSMQ